jgi:hypothetical protein
MGRRDKFKEAIDKLFESEVERLPRFNNMSEGQKEKFKGRFIDYMIQEIGAAFFETDDVGTMLDIAKFLANYSGHKPKTEHVGMISVNPFENMSDAELVEAEKRLLEYDESGEVEEA